MVAAAVTNVEGLCCDEHRVKEVIRQRDSTGALVAYGLSVEVGKVLPGTPVVLHDVVAVRRTFLVPVLTGLFSRIETAFASADTRGPEHVCFYQMYQAFVNVLVRLHELKKTDLKLWSPELQELQENCLAAIGCVEQDMGSMESRHEGFHAASDDISVINMLPG